MTNLQTFLGNADPALVDQANAQADAYGIPRNIFQALISTESSWNPFAKAKSTSAFGLTQLTTAAASDVGANVNDVADNLRGGADYLAQQYAATGDWNTALQRYYGGASGYKTNPGAQTYADKIMTLANSDSGNGSTMTGSNSAPLNVPLTMDGIMGYLQSPDTQAKKNSDTVKKATGVTGVTDFIQKQLGNVSFVVLGIVIVAVALVLSSKTAQNVIVETAMAA